MGKPHPDHHHGHAVEDAAKHPGHTSPGETGAEPAAETPLERETAEHALHGRSVAPETETDSHAAHSAEEHAAMGHGAAQHGTPAEADHAAMGHDAVDHAAM